jgi:probable F420-dependent oxidoreductase
MADNDLHFGSNLTLEVEETAKQAQWMERHGFEYFSAGEHFMRGDPPSPTHASLPVLAVAAGATTTLRIVSSIVLVPFYHPLVLARTTATLDAASNGRLTLGVGIGGEYPPEFENAGLKVNQRGRRTDECLEVMTRLWQGEQVDFSGRHFELEGASINPLPTQKPHPPVWVSGRRDAAMRRAARFGNGWVPYFFDPPRYRESVEKIHTFAEEEGRSLDGFQWAFFPYISIYPTEREAAEVAARQLGSQYLYGGEFINIVRRYCLLGTPEQCAERLKEYIDAGARHIVFSVTCPPEGSERHLEDIAGKLIPMFG